MSSPFVDVHTHFLPDFYREALREAGHLPGPSGFHTIPEWSVEDHLSFMQTNNIRKAYLSVSTPGTFLTAPVPNDDTALNAAKTLTRRMNEYGASLKKEQPSKFGFFASLPLPNIEAALEEIEYVKTNLQVDGFMFLSNAFGMYMGDPRLAPVYEKLNDMSTVVFVHPTTPCTSRHASSPSSDLVDPAVGLAANMPLSESYAGPMLEFLFDSTRTFCDILLTETATRYPNIRWIIPHCGSVLPSVLDRVVRFSQVIPPKAGSPRSLAALSHERVREIIAKQFFFDLAGVPMGSQIHHVLRWADHTRFMYGSDVPFTPWSFAKQLADEIRDELPRIFGVETGVHECMRICHGNAEQLFGGS